MLVTSNFTFSYSVFYLFVEFSFIFIKHKIVVCKLFPFERVLYLLFGKGLTPYHTIPTFNALKKRSPLKTLWEKEKMLVTSIFTIPTMFSTIPKMNFNFSVPFILLSANAFNFNKSYMLLFGKALNSLQDEKILDGSKLKAFADDKLQVAQMVNFVLGTLKNVIGKCWFFFFSHGVFESLILQMLTARPSW